MLKVLKNALLFVIIITYCEGVFCLSGKVQCSAEHTKAMHGMCFVRVLKYFIFINAGCPV